MQLGSFYREKPANIIQYRTVEFYHPDFGTLRYVFNQYSALTATLESGAPRNASTAVEFEPIAGQAPDPEQGKYGASIDIQLGLVGSEFKKKLNSITDVGRRQEIEVVWRLYLSDDLTAPALVYYMKSAGAVLQGRVAAITARQRNVAEISPWRRYKDDEFPGTATNA